MTARVLLDEAGDTIEAVAAAVHGRGRPAQAERLRRVAGALHVEAHVALVLDLDDVPEPVRRSYPPGAALGYLLKHDPATRHERALIGAWVPEPGPARECAERVHASAAVLAAVDGGQWESSVAVLDATADLLGTAARWALVPELEDA